MDTLQQLLTSYQKILIKHLDTIGYAETSLRTLLFLSPGRYRNTEFRLEAAYSVLGLISLFHDYLILKFLKKQEQKKRINFPDLPPSSCVPQLGVLSALQHSELALEVLAKQKLGEKSKWIIILIIETIKAFLKLKLLRNLKGHTVVYRDVPQYREIPNIRAFIIQESSRPDNNNGSSSPSNDNFKDQSKKKRDHRSVSQEKWKIFKAESQISSEPFIFTTPAPIAETLAEVSHIVRPVIYVLCILKYGKNSWKSWLASLFIELASLYYYTKSNNLLNSHQKDEASRRSSLLFYYLLRSPFYDSISGSTPATVKRVTNKLNNLPMIGSALGSLSDFINVYRDHYFYTSGS